MVNQSKGLHHLHLRKRVHHEKYPPPDKLKRVYDKLIYVAVVMGPIMNLPQLLKIWILKNAAGVSLISWISFSIISIFWVGYGLLHKDKPIIYMNFSLMIIQALIALGVIIYS